MTKIELSLPIAQINFANALTQIRSEYLQNALFATVASMHIRDIDDELHEYVDNNALNTLATQGIRGELLFPVPSILSTNPRLLGYYRLLLGYSQKEFYSSSTGAGIFKSMEEKGKLSAKQQSLLLDLCLALIESAQFMLEHLTSQMLDVSFFDQLTLLTLGPQLRGSANVQKGTDAILQVFNIVYEIVKPAVQHSTARFIELKNKSGRNVSILFSSDPDIVIREELAPEVYKNLVAIEVKGGQDYSNIHNRIGEAEKSHQKAKNDGYIECWTIINVDVDIQKAQHESPTTNRFYKIAELMTRSSLSYSDFRLQILSIVGI